MAKHKIGIIGYGGFGKFLHHSWKELDNAEVIAVADEIPDNRPKENILFYKNWQDLIKNRDVEIVSIATPPSTHAKIAVEAISFGKNLLIEKPLALNTEEGKSILEFVRTSKKTILVDFLLRYNPLIEKIREIYKEGFLGELRHVNVENYAQDQWLPPEHWFWDKKVSGGILVEHAVHFIDLVHYFTENDFTKVHGLTHKRNPLQEDTVFASVLYENGVIASHYHSFARPGFFEETTVKFTFDLAQVEVKGWIPLKGIIRCLVSSQGEKKLSQLPNFKVNSSTGIENLKDLSRPVGWSASQIRGRKKNVVSGGIEYKVKNLLQAEFDVGKPKSEVFADCVRGIVSDIISRIEDPRHKTRLTIQDGYKSLEIAELAARSAKR